MIDNYDALPLGTYMRVNAILDGDGDELEKQVQILAILSDKSPDDLLLLPLADYANMAKQSAFLRVPCKPATIWEDYRFQDLAPVLDFRKINTAQYIDFQTFAKDFPKSFPQLLSVFLVPAGMAYNDGYDIAVVQEQVKGIPMPEALGLAAFFFGEIATINRGFTNLLGQGNAEDEGPGETEGDTGEDNDDTDAFAIRWGWVANVDRAAETLRCSWDEVWKKPALEFLNTLAYRKDKQAWEKDAFEQWKRTH